jgi:hypothetical protein
MQIPKRVILLAKERALFGFSMLAQNMVSEARHNLQRPPQSIKMAVDPAIILEASHFLHRDSQVFVERLLTFYGNYLDRAMQTMYTDLRTGLHNMSADRLSLVDDETMNRQIEVDRLVIRMRDVDHENLGRLNITIAQLHGDHDVRERENPFRPYLLARSLHDVLNSMVKSEAVSRLLFDALSDVLVGRLPGFFAAIREVFESNGIRSRLLARPANLTRRQRELLRQQSNAGFQIGQAVCEPVEQIHLQDSNVSIQSGLRRMFETQKTVLPGSNDSMDVVDSPKEQAVAFQDFIWQMFNQKRPAPLPRGPVGTSRHEASGEILSKTGAAAMPTVLSSQLMLLQKEAAREGGGVEERNRLAVLREKIDHTKLAPTERITLDVVILLFEFIFQDEQVPADLRNEIGRLQVPFLRAAMLTPDLLQEPAHPARQLLNRLGSVAAALDMNQPADRRLCAEISAVVTRVMEKFEDDMVVFTDCLEEFEHFLQTFYRDTDQEAARRVAAIEEAEKSSVMLFNIGNTLRDLLPPLEISRQVSEFIMHIWSRVMATLLVRFGDNESLINQYRVILPELVWSVQPGHKPQERNTLMKLLPELVKRLKKGMELACVTEDESKKALDQLADVHMQVLRGAPRSPAKKGMTLEELYQHFSLLQVCEGSHLWTESEALTVQSEIVQAALTTRGVEAELHIQNEAIPVLATDEDWMGQMRLGIGAEVQIDKVQDLARLVWISEQRSLFMFVVEGSGQAVVYSSISLLKALRDGLLRPLEYAPLFERAVESLMISAESLQAAA